MSIFEHSRFKIFNPGQHPFRHDLSEFLYNNPRLPGISHCDDALDAIISALYPNYIGSYATPAALPISASPNDYAVVVDDGDGKSAGYVWISFDSTAQWRKRFDVDWSLEGILTETVNRTFPMYVSRDGFDQKDAGGNAITGLYAGQTLYGGASTSTNLTFNANSLDASGYVQTDNTFRPTSTGTLSLGTSALKWASGYINTLFAGTLTATSGSITDSSGAISFDNENLTTTGSITSNTLSVTTSASISSVTIASGSITSSTPSISFGTNNLSTSGTLSAGSGSSLGHLTFSNGSITDSGGSISFGSSNLSTTGTFSAGNSTLTRVDAGNIRVTSNAISTLNTDGSLSISANGVGTISFGSDLSTLNQTVTGTVTITGQFNADNLRLDANTLSSTNSNGNIIFSPSGTGEVQSSASIIPTIDGTLSLGKTSFNWGKLWISGSIGGTTEITVSDLLKLRSTNYRDFSRTLPAQAGDSLFYDAVNGVWLASHPDTEITHSELTGLTTADAGHTQFVMLTGRAGGQAVQGGTASTENLTLESTSHASKGSVLTKDNFRPFTNASYSGSWSGIDLGGGSNNFRDIYLKGEAKGFRFENFTSGTLPSASASSIGRTVFATDNNKLYTDTGGAWLVASVSRFINDTSWNGTDTSKTITVSSTLSDARNAIWQLADNSNNFDLIYCSIKAISATQITITVSPALPAGSYRLIGVE